MSPLVMLCGDFNDSPSSSACQVQTPLATGKMSAVSRECCICLSPEASALRNCLLIFHIIKTPILHRSLSSDGKVSLGLDFHYSISRCCRTMHYCGVVVYKRGVMSLQVVRDHWLGLTCIWDSAAAASSNGSAPPAVPFTTWKFRPDGVSQRTIDFIWCADHCCPWSRVSTYTVHQCIGLSAGDCTRRVDCDFCDLAADCLESRGTSHVC